MENLQERLKAARKHLGLTQAQAIEKFEATSWQRYESVKNPISPNASVLGKLHNEGININWILSGKGKMLLDDNAEPFNKEVMSKIIVTLEAFLTKNKKAIDAARKAELICVLHNHFADQSEEALDENKLEELIKVSAL